MLLTEKQRVDSIEQAERILGYTFKDKDLLLTALTHPSAVEEDPIHRSYERLEFLGDSLLGAFVAFTIFDRFPDFDEGALTRLKVSLVSGGMLSKRAEELGFSDLIIFGSSEKGTGGRGLFSALENVFEALTAAIALDGGVDAARHWALSVLGDYISRDVALKSENPKSVLQEALQVDRITPTYELIGTAGPPHARTFTCNVLCEGSVIGTGVGHSKKDAEVEAAACALQQIHPTDAGKKPK
ncbi:MAG: ribonuclease III [Coriobacteriales bacterium]|jgi:ribonuclease-3|nr:ribonuclease III [Coriobacteriales bacterium]